MKIAIFNDYQLPLPATRGGSVPTLTNFLLDENEKHHDFDIDAYSCFEKSAVVSATKYKFTKFIFSKDARFVRFFTNLLFILKSKLHIPFNLSNIPLPRTAKKYLKKQTYDAIYINGYIRGVLPIAKCGGHI